MDRLSATNATGDGGLIAAPQPRLGLRPDVHFAAIDQDAVLLDVTHDRYLCLPSGASLCRSLQDGGAAPDCAITAELCEAGLAGPYAPRPNREPPSRPTRTIIHDRRPFVLKTDARPAWAAMRHIRRARRGVGLSPYLALEGPAATLDPPAAIAAAQRFWSLLPYLPIDGECLVRSAMLMQFLRSLGLSADWVFGVRLCPFTAHCWVQVGEVCLNDDVERLVAYTPILVR